MHLCEQTFDLRRDLPLYLRVLRGAWAYHAVVVLVFATTLAVYPAITVLVEPSSQGRMQGLYGIQWRVELRILLPRLIGSFDSSSSESSAWNDVYFVPVCCFVLFNFGDYFGKQARS